MFIHVKVGEDSVLINSASIKSINSIDIKDMRRLYGIQIEFITKKEEDFIIQFASDAARDEALASIVKALKPVVSVDATDVELRQKGFSER